MTRWQCFQASQLPDHVTNAVAPHRGFWQFLEGNTSDEQATIVAKHLWNVFDAAAISALPNVQVEVAELIVKPGLAVSTWLTENREPLATAMTQLFQQLKPKPDCPRGIYRGVLGWRRAMSKSRGSNE